MLICDPQNGVHLDVVLLRGNIIEELEGETYTYYIYIRREKRQETVVLALAAP